MTTAKLPRRQFLHLAAGAAALPALPSISRAQAYPTRPVRLVVGFSAGGSPDVPARHIAQWLGERLGHQFVVENRPGAGGNIAAEAVIRAPADGYTLLQATVTNTWNSSLYDKLNFAFARDVAPVATIYRSGNVLLVHPSFPARTVPEFIAYAKAHPGQVNMAAYGNGSSPHFSLELFRMMAGVDLVQVQYRAAPFGLSALVAGEVHGSFATPASSIELVKSGKLRAMGVTSTFRIDALPDVPTVSDFLPGYEVNGWSGIIAPRNTSMAIIDKLNKEINLGLADPKIKVRFADLGLSIFAGSPSDFGKLIVDETEKWAKVIKAAGIKPE